MASRRTRRPPVTQYEPPADWTPTQAVENPILNSPYEEPAWHWTYIKGTPSKQQGRRPASYWFKSERVGTDQGGLFIDKSFTIAVTNVNEAPTGATLSGSVQENAANGTVVGTISGILLAMLMNNGGGAWDNAKKYIETGQFGGKRSDAHKAAVVGDTVGDPFKDTAGPSLHVLIKLLATITLVLAPLFI